MRTLALVCCVLCAACPTSPTGTGGGGGGATAGGGAAAGGTANGGGGALGGGAAVGGGSAMGGGAGGGGGTLDAGNGDAGTPDAGPDDAGSVDADPCAGGNVGSGLHLVSAQSLPMNQAAFATPGRFATEAFASTLNSVELFFSLPVDLKSAADASSFVITPSLAVTNVSLNYTDVTLTTAAQTPGTAYSVQFTGIASTDAGAFPNGSQPFTGYRSGYNLYNAGPGINPLEVAVIFSEPMACAPLKNAANFAVSGGELTSTRVTGACATTTRNVWLELDGGLLPGLHTLSVGSAVMTADGGPVGLPVKAFSAASGPGPFFVTSASASSVQLVSVQFNRTPNAAAHDAMSYTVTPPLSVLAVLPGVGSSITLNVAQMAPNKVYTLNVQGVGAAGTSDTAALPAVSFWSGGSFTFDNAFMLQPHQLKLFFSDTPSADAGSVMSYQFTGGVTASNARALGVGATVDLAGDQENTDYTVTVSGVGSATGTPLAVGHSGTVRVQLDAVAFTGGYPHVFLAGTDLSINQYLGFSADGQQLFVGTGPLPSGQYELKVCGLENAARTSMIRGDTVMFTVP